MFERIWNNICAHQGEIFTQIRGGKFSYIVKGNSLSLSNRKYNLSKKDLEEAFMLCPLNNTVPVQHLIAPSYIFSLLTDERIISGIDFSEKKVSKYSILLKQFFKKALKKFLKYSLSEIKRDVSERNLCVEFRDALIAYIKNYEFLKGYHIDNEYNRNDANPRKIKTIIGENLEIVYITCDLIIHSRGEIPQKDNMLAMEMKKSNAPRTEKDEDRKRLIALTKDSFDDVWSFDGNTLPEHVCRYDLGVYFELNILRQSYIVEYYSKGKMFAKSTHSF